MEVKILGALAIQDDHGRAIDLRAHHQIRALLSLLSLHDWELSAGQIHSLLWKPGTVNLTSALTSLTHRTRELLPNNRLINVNRCYRLERRPGDIWDVDLFRVALDLAQQARRRGDLDNAVRRYDEALRLWRIPAGGPPLLPDFAKTRAMRTHKDYLALLRQLRDAAEGWAEVSLDRGDNSREVSDRIQELLVTYPVSLRLHQLRMLSHYRGGRKGEALAAYRTATTTFERQIQAPPGPDLEHLRDDIAADDRALRRSPLIPATPKPMEAKQPVRRRVYDAALGGKDNYRSDRALLYDIRQQVGGAFLTALRAARRTHARMVQSSLAAGIDQFIDLGCGLPINGFPQTHDLALGTHPQARVLYVDNDPVVATHAAARMVDHHRTWFCEADLRDTTAVLYAARRHLDLTRPVMILATGVLEELGNPDEHDLGTADLAHVLAHYVAALPARSRIGLSHLSGTNLDPRLRPLLDATNSAAPLPHYLRTASQIRRLFGDLRLMPPGLIPATAWPSGRLRGQRRVPILTGLAIVRRAHSRSMRVATSCTFASSEQPSTIP